MDLDSISATLLGTLEVRVGTTAVSVGPPRRQAVLGFLVLKAGTAVSGNEVIDAVWGESAPTSVIGNLHTYVSDLRRLLTEATRASGPRMPLRTSGSGYVLDIAEENIDVRMFERELGTATRFSRTGEDAKAIAAWQRALSRWNGTPLSGIDAPYADAERARLGNLRLAAITDLVKALFARGTEADTRTALTTLDTALDEYPLHQRFAEWRIRILHSRGRRVEALQQYERTRHQLAEKLGIDPDTQLRAAFHAVLNGTVAISSGGNVLTASERGHETSSRPRLPSPPKPLVGRETEFQVLKRSVTNAAGANPRILAIDGPPGAGKTALALGFAHDIAARFPDGCYHLDLRGTYRDRAPLSTSEALRRLLTAVAGTTTLVPASSEDQLGTYRSLLANKRLLLVFDNVRHADQIRPLLPASGNALVVVTSRHRLTSLVAREGAVRVPLGPLPEAAAHEMITGPSERTEAEVAELVHLCGRLPLALRHVANLLAEPGERASALAARLRNERTRVSLLSRGRGEEEQSLEDAFAASVRALPSEEAELFTLLGAQHRTVITVAETSDLTGWTEVRVRRGLDRLALSGLLDWGTWDQYRMAPLLHAYAVGLHDAATKRLSGV